MTVAPEERPESRQEPALEPPPFSVPARPGPVKVRARGRSGWRWFWTLLFLLSILPLTILMLRWVPPPITAFMLQSETRPLHYQWVPRSRIAEALRKAVVAAEDQKFYMHQGFDLEAIEKALAANEKVMKRKRGRIRGGSTISQQTAKNLFLWPGGGYFRKGIEATITVLMEWFWGKERILEVYLNVAEFGPGIYGAEAAAQRFFGKPASALSAPEAARLAAVLPSPRRWSAGSPGPYVQKRAWWILGQMGARRGTAAEPVEAEPEPLPPPGEEMPALDAWQTDPTGPDADAGAEPGAEPPPEDAELQSEEPAMDSPPLEEDPQAPPDMDSAPAVSH